MTTILAILREIVGLFVDDGSLAVSILATVAVAAVLAFALAASSELVGAVLVLGCFLALIASTLRAA